LHQPPDETTQEENVEVPMDSLRLFCGGVVKALN
jgi:hypothetical protein